MLKALNLNKSKLYHICFDNIQTVRTNGLENGTAHDMLRELTASTSNRDS